MLASPGGQHKAVVGALLVSAVVSAQSPGDLNELKALPAEDRVSAIVAALRDVLEQQGGNRDDASLRR